MSEAKRRLLFVCPSLAAGRSGVGDYTRRLAGAMRELGWRCRMLALGEEDLTEGPVVEGDVFRCRMGLPGRREGGAALERWLAAEPPGWVSLQFVCYGFHVKGLPFGLGRRLRRLLPGARFHVMFHETWTGGPGSPLRRRVIGWLQRRIVARLPGELGGAVCHTQALPYQEQLRGAGVTAGLLPLFGNIERAEAWPRERFAAWLRESCGLELSPDEQLAVVFGTVYPGWDFAGLFDEMERVLRGLGRRWVVLGVGRLGAGGAALEGYFSKAGHRALRFAALGPLEEEQISQCLHAALLGLSATPPDLIQKSGAAAAMFEHGVAVLASRPPVFGPGMLERVRAQARGLLTVEELGGFLENPAKVSCSANGAGAVARQLSAAFEL